MSIEAKRGCGYRKVGGLYLVSGSLAALCDRLPYRLKVCPVCNQGIKFTRGITWIDAYKLFGIHTTCQDEQKLSCPLCAPNPDERYGLMWVGEKYYSPESFTREATQLGVSKRIRSVPKDLVLGKTWIFLAHRKALLIHDTEPKEWIHEEPGIFQAFRPDRIEKLITESQATSEEIAKLKERGITPVVVPDDDPDHAEAKRRVITDEV